MPKVICFHCEREYEGIERADRKYPPCPGCEELGHHGPAPENCPACQADKRQPGEQPPGDLSSAPKAVRRGRKPSQPPLEANVPRAAEPDRKTTLISTLRGLAVIADLPMAQRTAEELLLAYIDDEAITAAYRPFARKPE